MSVVRRFLVIPALARLIRKERGGSKITEGYFAPQGGRTSLVRIDGPQCHLVLINTGADGAASEERTEVPRAHGDALLDVCGGKAVYERTTLLLGAGRDILIDRYVTPAGLDLISVPFDDDGASKGFRPPVWFGPEVSTDAAYERHAIALKGPPEPARLGLNNAMLDAVLDLLEPRFGLGRFGGAGVAPPAAKPAEDEAAPRAAAGNGAAPPRPASTPPAAPVREAPPRAVPVAQAANAIPSPQAPPARPAPPPARPAPPPAAAIVPPAPAPAASRPPAPAAQAIPAAKPPEPKPEAAPQPQVPAPAAAEASPEASKDDAPKGDARIDDVIESLSQALGAAIQQPQEPARSDDLAASFERWTVRPRRTQQ